ncbi:hypothetical protein FRB99_005892 [Tulasnella sp. 403]|nr:hypothetical protein FRB99_005892 [Tulasnella sp. 403]
MAYKLSTTLAGHSSDVRAIVSPSPTLVVSASRDHTAVVWRRPDDKSPFTPSATYKASERYVNAVAFLDPTPQAPQGYVVTGSQDAIINVYALGSGSGDPIYVLLGHSSNVCSLATTPSGAIISGSWDQTARVWKNFQYEFELKGHSASVLAVLALSDDQFLTASADKTIKLWHHHKEIRTFAGHTDAVRGLALIPDIGFASCSNDTEIRVWTPEGDTVYTLTGHTSFVYSLAVLPNGDIVSGGEDRTVRVWRDGECFQTIVQPAISVWTVTACPNGDIISGASDFNVRIFSPAEERWAPEADLKAYEDHVASYAVPSQTSGMVDASTLPGEEALNTPGTKEGQNKLVKSPAGRVDVYTWTGGTWMKVGEMTDAVGSTTKKMYRGREWDYVFEVDVKEGAPKLKLPYNANENHYVAAQRFLNDNDLPPAYLDQVAKFIEQQTGGISLPASNEFVDPYTGASRYQASAATQPTRGASAPASDPFTGASRYQAPSNNVANSHPQGNFGDPFTGASRYTPTAQQTPVTPQAAPQATPQASTSSTKVLPVISTLPFRQCNVAAMRTKTLQINETLKSEITTSVVSISKSELQAFERTFAFLQTASTSTSNSRTQILGLRWVDVDVVLQVLSRWPESQHFPLIDLLRLITYFCPSPSNAPPNYQVQILDTLLEACSWEDWVGLPEDQIHVKSWETNILLALRALTNCFQIDGQNALFSELSKTRYNTLNKNQRLALATLLFNFSCVAKAADVGSQARPIHLNLVTKVLQEETTDSETAYRALVALGNRVYGNQRPDKSLWSVVEPMPARFNEDRVKVLTAEIKQLLKV